VAAELEENVVRLFRAFNRRTVEDVVALCAEDVRFESATAEFAGREGTYSGREGMRRYFEDVEQVWEELLITPRRILVCGEDALAVGRVFARSRRHGLRDLPVAWRLRSEAGGFGWIKVYGNRLEALRGWPGGAGA
jgi:ketosteroid isomerase-like protein